jgi:hypothetical protein
VQPIRDQCSMRMRSTVILLGHCAASPAAKMLGAGFKALVDQNPITRRYSCFHGQGFSGLYPDANDNKVGRKEAAAFQRDARSVDARHRILAMEVHAVLLVQRTNIAAQFGAKHLFERLTVLLCVLTGAQGREGSIGSLETEDNRIPPCRRDRQRVLLGKVVDKVRIADPDKRSVHSLDPLAGRLSAEFLTVNVEYHGDLIPCGNGSVLFCIQSYVALFLSGRADAHLHLRLSADLLCDKAAWTHVLLDKNIPASFRAEFL